MPALRTPFPAPHSPLPALRSLCVFCGSSPGTSATITKSAQSLGAQLAAHGITLVYGGGGRGVMCALADGALAGGGRVVGVIPRSMVEREWAHTGLTELHVVDSMHERKATMASLADGFVALPGGIGTIDEFFEVWTWWQLGLHSKPCAILNVDGYFEHLLAFIDHMVDVEFLPHVHRAGLIVEQDVAQLIERLRSSHER